MGKEKQESETGTGSRNNSVGREGTGGEEIRVKDKHDGKAGSRNNSTGRGTGRGANESTTTKSKSKTKDRKNTIETGESRTNMRNPSLNKDIGLSDEEPDEPEDCVICRQTFSDSSDKMLQCERCSLWTCAGCANVSDAEYAVMSRPDCHWYCDGHCNQRATRAVLDEKSVEDRCKEFLKNFESRLENIEKEMAQKASKQDVKKLDNDFRIIEKKVEGLMTAQVNVEEIVTHAKSEAANSGLKEMEDRDMRKANLILFGVEESDSATASVRKEEDIKKLEEICSKGLEVDITVKQVKRLGKFEKDLPDGERKPRPVLAALGSQQNVVDALKASKKLTTHTDRKFHAVSIKKDMTPLEREEMRNLVKLRDAKRAESKRKGERANWVIRGKNIINTERKEEPQVHKDGEV